MTLDEALIVLADSYTRDDDRHGFTLPGLDDVGAQWTHAQLFEAWRVVLLHLGRIEGTVTAARIASGFDDRPTIGDALKHDR